MVENFPLEYERLLAFYAAAMVCNSKANDIKVLEHLKTTQYHLWNKLDSLEKKLTPVLNILTKLTEELEEDNE